MIAPDAIVKTAMIAAVIAPKVPAVPTLVGLLLLGDDQRAEEDHAGDQRADREKDQAKIEIGPPAWAVGVNITSIRLRTATSVTIRRSSARS